MCSKKHKRFGSAPFRRKDWISISVSLELGHYIHLARAITRTRASIILCPWYWVVLYNGFFSHWRRVICPKRLCFFFKHLTLVDISLPSIIYWLLSCWLTLEAPQYLLLVNHFHILLSFFVLLLALGLRLLLRKFHSNKNQPTSKIQLFVTNISVRVLKTRRFFLGIKAEKFCRKVFLKLTRYW